MRLILKLSGVRRVAAVSLVVVLLGSCGTTGDAGNDDGLAVVAAFYPLAEAARRIGGDRTEVVNLTPPGVEPHDLELAPDDLEAISTADVVLYVGGGFQPALEDAATQATTGQVLEVVEGFRRGPAPHGEEEAHGDESEWDPHVWLDPELYGEIVARAADAMAAAAPADAARFEDNAGAFRRELAELDRRFEDALSSCERRTIVVNHLAFGYLAAAYDLEQVGISGLSPEAEPDPDRLAELVRFVRENGVTTIFTEELVAPEVAEVLAREAGVRTRVLYTLEGLTNRQVAAGDDYVTVMGRNLEALREALGCA